MAQVYLSLGSNVGDRQKFLHSAVRELEGFCRVEKISSVYATQPWGKTGQPEFLNICLMAKTSLKPKELLTNLKDIEARLGRTKTEKWGKREIDIDILVYDSLVEKNPDLTLPHPHIQERAFVIIPLSEIVPDLIHPVLKKPIKELAENIDTAGVEKLVKIMGILNVTPDSFSDGGELADESVLNQRIEEMVEAGADIIDIGGESTRPGHEKVSTSEEISRVLPAVKAVRQISKDILISIDTQKSEVAQKALEAGANIINDVSAFSDPKMPEIIKKYGSKVILMRNRPLEGNIVASCKTQFKEIIEKCQDYGIDKTKIILDPGLGFGDLASGNFSALPGGDPSANTQLVLSIKDYDLDLPVLIGASRKRFLGRMSGQEDAKKRLKESPTYAVLAKYSGAAIIRVHDVAETIKALRGI